MSEKVLKSDCILHEIEGCSLAEQIVEVDEEQVKLVIFLLGNHLFAFFGSAVREILPEHGITWIPGATEFIPGVINVRGDIEAVIDLGRVLGITETRKSQGYFVMAQIEEHCIGILVDSIIDVVDVAASAIKQPLLTLDARFSQLVANQLEFKEQIVNILYIDQILNQVS